MIRFRGLVACLSLLLAMVACGYDGGEDYTRWMRFDKSSVYWNLANWYDPETAKALVAPVEGKKYYVPSGKTIKTPSDSSPTPLVPEFPGDVLAIAGTLSTPSYLHVIHVKELWMLPGFVWSPSTHLFTKADGIVRVKGTSASSSKMIPFLFDERVYTWRQNFYGDESAFIQFTNTGSGGNAKTRKFDRESAYASHVVLTGDWSQFYGTAQITTNNYLEINAPGYRTFGGKVYINGGYFCFKSNSGEFQLRELQMDYGGELRCYGVSGVPTRCVYSVSKEVKFSGPCYIYYEGDLPFGSTPIIRLTDEAAQNPPNLTNLGISPYSCGGNVPDGVNIAIVDNGDSTKTIALVREDTTVIREGQTLTSSKTSDVENYGVLKFEDNTKVYFNVVKPYYAGSVVHCVSNRLELQGVTYVGMSSLPTNDAITVFRLSGDAAAASSLNLARLQFDPKLIVEDLPANTHAELKDNGDGTIDVQMVWDKMKHMIVDNSGYTAANSAFNPANASYWADGELPAPTYNGAAFIHASLVDYSFSDRNYPNMRMLFWPFANGVSFQAANYRPHVTKLVFKGLHVLGSFSMSTYSGPTPTKIDSPIYFKNTKELETMYFYLRDRRVFEVNEPFNGDYDVYTRTDNDNGYPGTLELVAPNTNFAGRIIVTSGPKKTPLHLVLHDGRNLGGAYGRDDGQGWKSFEVDNFMRVSNVVDVVFNEPTRGMYVKEGANLDVPVNTTFEIGVPITYGGEIRKNGPGTLVLGGEAKFANAKGDQVAIPIEGSNVLAVVNGSICIAHTNALDGVSVRMNADTRFLINPERGAKSYGAVMCRDGSGMVTESGKLPVDFEPGYQPSDLRVDCGIITVPADRVDDYEFDYPTEFDGRAVTLERRGNPDGTVTFYLSLAGKAGFCVYFEQEKEPEE